MGCLPGSADLGTVNVAENVPVDEVAAVATWVPLKSTATVSLAPNPAPVTVTFVVGGPTAGFRVMLVVAAAAGAADKPTASITLAAASVSTRDRPRRPENPAISRARSGRAVRTLTERVTSWHVRTGPPPPPQEAPRPSAP